MFKLQKFANDYPEIGALLESLMGKLPDKIHYLQPETEVINLAKKYFSPTISTHKAGQGLVDELRTISPKYVTLNNNDAGIIDCSCFITPKINTDHIWLLHRGGKLPSALLFHELGHYIDLWVSCRNQFSRNVVYDETGAVFDTLKSAYLEAKIQKYPLSPIKKTSNISAHVNALAIALLLDIPINQILVFIALDAISDSSSIRLLSDFSKYMRNEFNDEQELRNHVRKSSTLKRLRWGNKLELHNVCVVSSVAYWLLSQNRIRKRNEQALLSKSIEKHPISALFSN